MYLSIAAILILFKCVSLKRYNKKFTKWKICNILFYFIALSLLIINPLCYHNYSNDYSLALLKGPHNEWQEQWRANLFLFLTLFDLPLWRYTTITAIIFQENRCKRLFTPIQGLAKYGQQLASKNRINRNASNWLFRTYTWPV